MRMRQLFTQTLREVSTEVTTASQQLLMRAGFVRPLTSGTFVYLPLGLRTLRKLETLLCEELTSIGGQEIVLPLVQPADAWEGMAKDCTEGTRFEDRLGREMWLSMSGQFAVADLGRIEIQSYRQFPLQLYQIQWQWHDGPRLRGGAWGGREFLRAESYSLDVDPAGLEKQYRAHYQAFFNICHHCGLSVDAVTNKVGSEGEVEGQALVVGTPVGSDILMYCDTCGYKASQPVARFQKHPAVVEVQRPLEKVATPGVKTIEALTEFLEIPADRTAKALFMVSTIFQGAKLVERFVLGIIRGDLDVSESKLASALDAVALRPATEAEIRAVGAEPGYGSPLGVHDVIIVVDESILRVPNLVAGANEEGVHLRNVNYNRDFVADLVCDIANAREGDLCPHCGAPLSSKQGVKIAELVKLGTRYTQVLNSTFVNQEDRLEPIVMGAYHLDLGKMVAVIAEEHHDAQGLIWPISISPYQLHLVSVGDREDVVATSERLYRQLQEASVEVLYDDRLESPGVKFMDADLIGIPLRLTVGGRGLKRGGVELKRRDCKDSFLVSLEEVVPCVQAEIATLHAELVRAVVSVPGEGDD